MSYKQAMKWARKHPKGVKITPLNLGFSTGSGFWPSQGFIEKDWLPYLERCKAEGKEPVTCEVFYNSLLRRA